MGVNNGSKVAAAKPKVGGGMYWAAGGSTLPTDATTALDAAFVALGPISDAGVTPSRDTSIEKIKEWDGSTLAALLTDESRSFEAILYGVHDQDVLEALFGADNVTVTAPAAGVGTTIAVVDKGGKLEAGVLVLEMVYRGVKQRKVIPVADLTITGEEPYAPTGLRGYTVTVEALKDDAGAMVYEYAELDDAAA